MRRIKMFENFMSNDINIIIDVSSTMKQSDIDRLPEMINCDSCDKINVLLVDDQIRKINVISDLTELPMIFKNARLGAGGTNLQVGVEYIIDNGLEQNKTYIVSDFYTEPLDYSGLSEYEEILI